MNALSIVANSDDEIIGWGGRRQRARWDRRVLSLSRGGDGCREARCYRVCRHLRGEGIISSLDDDNPPAQVDPVPRRCEAALDADVHQTLPDGQLARKKHIIGNLYGYGGASLEVTAWVSPEGLDCPTTGGDGELT